MILEEIINDVKGRINQSPLAEDINAEDLVIVGMEIYREEEVIFLKKLENKLEIALEWHRKGVH